MAFILDIGTKSSIAPGFKEITNLDRGELFFSIKVDGIDLNKIGGDIFISHISLYQSVNMIDYLELILSGALDFDSVIFSEGSIIELSIGYLNSAIFDFGKFFISSIVYSDGIGGKRIKLKCYGELFFFSQEEKRRSWNDVFVSDVVNAISVEQGYSGDIENTSIRYEHIIQANESDYSLLKRLSFLNGFVFWARNSELIFRSVDVFGVSGKNSLFKIDFLSKDAAYSSVKIEVFSFGRAYDDLVTFIDPINGNLFSLKRSDLQHVDNVLLINKDLQDKKLFSDISIMPRRYIMPFGINLSFDEIKRMLDSISFFDEFVIKMNLSIRGIEGMFPGDLLEIVGLGRFDGVYFVSKVDHKIGATGQAVDYKIDLECWKKFVGSANIPSNFDFIGSFDEKILASMDVTNSLKFEGIVEVD